MYTTAYFKGCQCENKKLFYTFIVISKYIKLLDKFLTNISMYMARFKIYMEMYILSIYIIIKVNYINKEINKGVHSRREITQ